jgi:hypothetical protein
MQLALPQLDGSLRSYVLQNPASPYANVKAGPLNRTVYAAAHVVVDRCACDPGHAPAWTGTPPRVPRTLWRLGLRLPSLAAQRGMGVDWPMTNSSSAPPRETSLGGPRLRRRHTN